MQTLQLQRFIFLSLLFFIFILAWLLQQNLFLNVDVSWLLEATKRMLAGGNYAHDFFENNPPWILYFSIPPILISKWLAINLFVSMRFYIFILSFVALYSCSLLLHKILDKKDKKFTYFLIIGLAILFLILPLMDFAQREHVLFILSLPYIFLMVMRLQGEKIKASFALVIGFLVGSVLLLKPYFFCMFFLLEGYHLVKWQKIRCLVRPEILSVGLLGLIYFLLLMTRHMDYLTEVLPFAWRWCYLGVKKPWNLILQNVLANFCYVSFLFYIATFLVNRYRLFTNVLMFATIGFFLSYLLQQTDWSYHLYPTFALCIFLSLFQFGMWVTGPLEKLDVLVLIIFMCLLCFFLKNTFFMLGHVELLHPPFIFYVMICSFIVTFYLSANQKKLQFLFYMILGTLLFWLPACWIFMAYQYGTEKKTQYQPLISYLNQHASNQSVYFFTTSIEHVYPILPLSKATQSASRFSFLWGLPGLVKQSRMAHIEKYLQDKNFLIKKIVDDLTEKKPALLFVDTTYRKNSLWGSFGVIDFNYLTYFKENANFAAILKNYQFKETLSQTMDVMVNPFKYHLRLLANVLPPNHQIKPGVLYVYPHQHRIEIVFRDDYGDVRRLPLIDANAPSNQIVLLKNNLFKQEKLSLLQKLVFFQWISKHSFQDPLYQFNVYQLKEWGG